MKLDLLLLAVVAIVGLMGLFSGAIKQVSHWLGLALAYLVVKPIAMAHAPAAAARLGLPRGFGAVALVAVAMLLAFALGGPLFRLIIGKLLPARENTSGDRLAGLALGAAKGAAIVFVVLCAAVCFDKPLAQAGFDLDAQPSARGSASVAFARRHNLFDTLKLPVRSLAQRLAAARTDPRAAQELLSSSALQSALDDPQLKAALDDPAVKEALRGGDPSQLLQNPAVRKLLDDPQLAQSLAKLEPSAEAIAAEAGRTTDGH